MLTPQPPIAAPSPAAGATVARIVMPAVARPAPAAAGGRPLGTETGWSAQPQRLLVLASATAGGHEWVQVRLPDRPNSAAGWVRRDHVTLTRTRWFVEVRTASRRVIVFRAGRPVMRARAVVGARGTPTPRGLSALYERNRQPDPSGFLGPWSLPLTAHSRVLARYGGGPGRVAIHGRGAASLADPLGSARSHGCVRIPNAAVAWMARRLPAGTPVLIRP
jgi:lipoprotein-anchoring transpeptidase ErfK/SrfK